MSFTLNRIPTSWHNLQSSILTTYSQNKQALFAILPVQTPLPLSWNVPTSGWRTPGLPINIKSNRGEWSFDPAGTSINSIWVCQCRLEIPKWFLCSPSILYSEIKNLSAVKPFLAAVQDAVLHLSSACSTFQTAQRGPLQGWSTDTRDVSRLCFLMK